LNFRISEHSIAEKDSFDDEDKIIERDMLHRKKLIRNSFIRHSPVNSNTDFTHAHLYKSLSFGDPRDPQLNIIMEKFNTAPADSKAGKYMTQGTIGRKMEAEAFCTNQFP
jgi:hypothetical protein